MNYAMDHTIERPDRISGFKFDDVEVTLPELRVIFRGTEVHFTLTEMRLLLIFLEHPHEMFSSDELIHRLRLTGPASLHTLINSVRNLLDQSYIHTCRSRGFTFARPA